MTVYRLRRRTCLGPDIVDRVSRNGRLWVKAEPKSNGFADVFHTQAEALEEMVRRHGGALRHAIRMKENAERDLEDAKKQLEEITNQSRP